MTDFQRLIGEQLSAVVFVQDYMQLQFDGYHLTTYTTPLVKTENGLYLNYADEAYKNRICSFITQRVQQVSYEEEKQLSIGFSEGVPDILVPLPSGKDNIYYSDFEDRWFVI